VLLTGDMTATDDREIVSLNAELTGPLLCCSYRRSVYSLIFCASRGALSLLIWLILFIYFYSRLLRTGLRLDLSNEDVASLYEFLIGSLFLSMYWPNSLGKRAFNAFVASYESGHSEILVN